MTDATGRRDMADQQVEIAELRTQVAGVKTDIVNIQTGLNDLIKTINAKSATPWGIIWSAAGVLVVVVGGYMTLQLAPITHDLDRYGAKLDAINDKVLAGTEIDRRIKVVDDRLSVSIDRNSQDLKNKLDASLATEYVKRLEDTIARDTEDQRRVESQIASIQTDRFTKDDAALLNERISVLSNRLNAFIDKNIAVSRYPVIPGTTPP